MQVDFERFWADDEIAHRDNCFYENAPQVALGIRMSGECVFSQLQEEGDPWGELERTRRIELNKRYNEKAIETVGRKLLPEEFDTEDMKFPYVKQIGDVFGGKYEYIPYVGMWLSSDMKTYKDLEKRLDEVERINLRDFMFSDNYEAEKKRIYETYGKRPNLRRHVRGPVTLAMSLFGEENVIFMYYDEPDLFKRFSETILNVLLKMTHIMDEEAGYTKENAPHGYSFADDNCALLNPEMYEVFGYPILKKMFETFSPNIGDKRYQHSDSEMSHLLPILGKLNLTGCNFGPTVLVNQIREHMKNTRIDGCLAPFTFMSNDKEKITKEIKRDIDMIKLSKTKGLNISTAGSINNGSSLESLRHIMELIMTYGRY